MMLHINYQGSRPCGFRQEDFSSFSYISKCKTFNPPGGASFVPRTGDLDCVAAVERLPALHYCVDSIFLAFGIIGSIVEL